MEEYKEIIDKARELSLMIRDHEYTVKYRETSESMRADAGAQKLLADLIRVGRELAENADSDEDKKKEISRENDYLNQELKDNDTVKNHILAQKQYLDLIRQMQERIKNPHE